MPIFLHYSDYSGKALHCISFFRPHKQKINYTSYNYEKADCDKLHFERRHTIYSYFDFSLKNSSFWLPYQHLSSSADCAREQFKGSNGSASLVDCTRKKFLVEGADCL